MIRVQPSDLERLRALVGSPVEVRLEDGEVREGMLAAVDGGTLVVEVHATLGAGAATYTARLPLDRVAVVVHRSRP